MAFRWLSRCVHVSNFLRTGYSRPVQLFNMPWLPTPAWSRDVTTVPTRSRPDPHRIGVTRSWETISAVMPTGGVYDPADLLADACIRNLIRGVFPGHKHLVIKKKENTITISFYIKFKGLRRHPPAVYFLVGFTETLLTHWLGARVRVDVHGEPEVNKQRFLQ